LPLQIVGKLSYSAFGNLAFGDTDRDCSNEVILSALATYCNTYRVYERTDAGSYILEYESPDGGDGCNVDIFAVGDLDSDGKMEFVGQWSYYLRVYESLDGQSHPGSLVWQSQPISNVLGYPVIADTDRDGRMEIIHSMNLFSFSGMGSLLIFESTADDMFELKFTATMLNSNTIEKRVADLDGDGLVEIAVPGLLGYLHVFESPADDVWVSTFLDTMELQGAYGIEGPVDTDRDGRGEFLVVGTGQTGWETWIYETEGDDQFVVTGILGYSDGWAGGGRNALGDLDSDGQLEYLMSSCGHLQIYRAARDGGWDYVGEFLDPQYCPHTDPYAFDSDGDGRAEIFWAASGDSTLILEWQQTSSNAGLEQRVLALVPNPFRASTSLQVPEPFSRAVQLSVYDVTGRRIVRALLPAGARVFPWDASGMAAGIYMVRIEGPNEAPLASTKAIIIR